MNDLGPSGIIIKSNNPFLIHQFLYFQDWKLVTQEHSCTYTAAMHCYASHPGGYDQSF